MDALISSGSTWTDVVGRVDVDKIIGRVDVEKIIERVDVEKIIQRVDIDAMMEQTELGTIIARSTSGVASEVARRDAGPGRWASTTSAPGGSTGSCAGTRSAGRSGRRPW